jgi:hypothetical protein
MAMRDLVESLKLFFSMHLSGRITKHLFDPVTLVGGVAVMALVVVLMALSFGGDEPETQRKRRSAVAPVAPQAESAFLHRQDATRQSS